MPSAERAAMQVSQHLASMPSRQDHLAQFLRSVQAGDIMTLPAPALNFNYDKDPHPVPQQQPQPQQRQSQPSQQPQLTSGSQYQPQTHVRRSSLQHPTSHSPAAPGAPGQPPVTQYPPPAHPNPPLPPPILPLQAGPAVPHSKAPPGNNPYPAAYHPHPPPAMPARAPNALPAPPVPQPMHVRPPVHGTSHQPAPELARQGIQTHRGSITGGTGFTSGANSIPNFGSVVTGGQAVPPPQSNGVAAAPPVQAGSTSTTTTTTTTMATTVAANAHPFSVTGPSGKQQSHLVHEAMIAALTPVQTGVEQLWALAVNNFRSVIEKMHAGFIDAIQNERSTALALKVELEKQKAENARLQDRVGSLEKEVKEVREAYTGCSADMVRAQQEAARLAGEKGGLEIRLKSMEVVQRRLLSQSSSRKSFSSSSSETPAPQLSLLEMVQKEVSEQMDFKLQAAFRDVQQQRALREQAERKMQAMMKRVKASLADLDVDVEDNSLIGIDPGPLAPSREASTAVGSPSPKFQPPSRKPSMDVLSNSLEPSPFCIRSSTSTSPTLLKSVPPIERRETIPTPMGPPPPSISTPPPPPLPAQTSLLPTPPSSSNALPSSSNALPSSAQGFSLARGSSPTPMLGPRVLQNADDDHYDRDDGNRDGSRKRTASPRSLSQTRSGGPTGLGIRPPSVVGGASSASNSRPGSAASGTRTPQAEARTVGSARAGSLGLGRGSSAGPSSQLMSQPTPTRASSFNVPPAIVAGFKRPRSATDSFKLPSSSAISDPTTTSLKLKEGQEKEEEGTGEPPAVRRRVSLDADVSTGQVDDTDDQAAVVKDESDVDQLMDESSDDTLNDDPDHNARSSPVPVNPSTSNGDAEMLLEEGEVEEERASSPWQPAAAPAAPSLPVSGPKGPASARGSGVAEHQQRNRSSTVHAHAPPVRTSRPYPFKRVSEHPSSSSSQALQSQPAPGQSTAKGVNAPPLSVNTASSSRPPPNLAAPRSGGASHRPEFYPPSSSSASQAPRRPPQSSTSTHPAPSSSAPSQTVAAEHPRVAVKAESELAAQPAGKLSVKHWDLLYIDDGNKWKCRLCVTFAKQLAKDNSTRSPDQQISLPRVAFTKDTNSERSLRGWTRAMDVNGIERRPQGESTYVSSLTAATIPPPAATSSPVTSRSAVQQQKNQNSAEQDRDRQADEFNKSVTIVFWYKAKVDPIILQQLIPTFPFFQLSRLGTLIGDLGLSSNSYLDTFNPISSKWEQNTISTDEVHLQHTHPYALATTVKPHPTTSVEATATQGLKRYASDALDSVQPTKIHVPNNYYTSQLDNAQGKANQQAAASSQQVTAPVSLPTPPSTAEVLPPSSSSDESSYIYRPQPPQQQQSYYASPAATPNTNPIPSPYTASSSKDHSQQHAPVHYPPHPPLKRWPNDYTVYELTVGFNAMDTLIAQSPAGDNMTQRVAFERIFGLRYVKSTVCRHRAIWKKADRGLRQQFEALGTDQRACWGEFVRRVEGRPSGKPGTGGGIPLVTGAGGVSICSSLVYSARKALLTSDFVLLDQAANGASGADEHQTEPVMDSLQIPGGNQDINVYDPSLTQHLPNGSHS
ncbi:hypothetical protein MD484_g4422, partial [Candolleomyces efflorescens]